MKKIVAKILTITMLIGLFSLNHNSAEAKTVWKFFAGYGSTEGACSFIWQDLFDEVEKQTNGELVIKPFWAGQHPYSGTDLLKALQDGSAQIASFYGPFLSSTEPIFELDAIPMLMPSDALKSFNILRILWGDFKGDESGPLAKVLKDNWNATLVHLIPASQQRLFTNGYASNKLDSLKGHKIRASTPAIGAFIEALGGTPISIAWGEIYTALSQGLIDGTVTSTFFANSTGFMDICDNINLWEISGASDGLMVSRDALAELPEDVREIFLKVMYESATKPEMAELTDNALTIEKLALLGKVINAVSEEDRNAVAKKVHEKLIPEWRARVGENADLVLEIIEKNK